MDTLSNLRKRAVKFSPKEIAVKSGLSKAYVTELLKGDKTNPSLGVFERLEKAVVKMEAVKTATATKKKTSVKPAKKQRGSRDARKRSVAGKGV